MRRLERRILEQVYGKNRADMEAVLGRRSLERELAALPPKDQVLFQWLLLAVRHGYEPAYPRLEEFLNSQGRRKFLKPLYEELVKTPAGKERALRIYRQARPTYHPIAVETVDAIVGWKETP